MKFEIDEKQIEQFKKWDKKHRKKCSTEAGAIGGRLEYIFTPIGLGMIIEVRCLCGEKIDLTDNHDW